MSHPNLDTEQARQGERKSGMPTVLAVSTIAAALVVGLLFVFFGAGI
ncbi:hypothetical protein [Ponticaulis profundi]|uniref:Uncharacterized protein n=1 Tax=Ponticaulis profundi TaxID=2665222 RepID=A0ABW1S5T1_9PROT